MKNEQAKKEFARLLTSGVKPEDAYRHAFNKPDASYSAARSAAWRLKRTATVAQKMQQMEKALDKRAVASKQERMEALTQLMRENLRDGDTRGVVACVGELNKMDGAYEPEKVEVRNELSVESLLEEICVEK